MAKVSIFNQKGESKGQYKPADGLLKSEVLSSVLHRAVVAEEANSRQGTQCTKTRAEVRGGGRKPYKQKKTGNARQGSIRSPHYRHGGVVFAPKPRDYSKKINKKERRSAIVGALSQRLESGDVLVLDKLAINEPKTKEAQTIINSLELNNTKRVLLVVSEYNEAVYKSFRNISNVTIKTAPRIQKGSEEAVKTVAFSTRDLLVAHKIVFIEDALKKTEEAWLQ